MDQIHHNKIPGWKFCLFVTILTASQISAAGFEPFSISSQSQSCTWSQNNINSNNNSTTVKNSNNNHDKATSPTTTIMAGSIFCNVRTLNSDFWNTSRINEQQKESTMSIHIKCNDKLFFESTLNQSSLQSFAELPKLTSIKIESCKIRKLSATLINLYSWRKLFQQQLKSFTIQTFNNEWSNSIELELEPNLFTSTSPNTFGSSSSSPSVLENIDLSYNNIWNVPNSLFCPLTHLKSVNLSHNHLIEVPHEFGNVRSNSNNECSSLSILDLSANSIRKLEQNAFINVKRLVKLNLGSNYIDELEDFAFNNLQSLKKLNLTSNRLVALPPSIFKPTIELTELYLQNNSISALSSSVLSNLSQLLLLDLSNNLLSSQWIKGNVFSGLIRLIVLKLSYNQLSIIDSNLFSSLTSLQALYLNNNRIEKLDPLAFTSLTNLHVLDLSRNLLVFIDSKQFSHSFILKQLYLDHNRIRTIDNEAFTNCTSLQDLGLAGNLLLEVPEALGNNNGNNIQGRKRLLNLKTLDIGENKISSITNESFSGLTKLYGLRIVDNRINELPPNFCSSLKSLRVLNFGQNRLQKISSTAFLGCTELRALRLDKNLLEELPNTYSIQLPKLLWLNLTENQLKYINPMYLPTSLEWIDLSFNQLESLGDFYREDESSSSSSSSRASTSSSSSHLRVLDASHNNLTFLDYRSIPISLETLRLNNNKLKSIGTDTFIRARRLRKIELVDNEIQSLPLSSLRFSTFYVGQPPPEISFNGNPFQCSCDLEWTTRVNQLAIQRQYPKIIDFDQLECQSVLRHSSSSFSASSSMEESTLSTSSSNAIIRNGRKIPLRSAKPSDFLCPYKTICFPLCACCEFEACDCNFQCPNNCTCHHDLSWSANIVQCSNLGLVEHLPSRIPMDATELYLDGNNFPILSSHIFIGKRNLRTLALNSSSIQILKNKTFNGLKSLEKLYLNDNLLTQFDGYEFNDLENLVELYLHNNLIKYITPTTFHSLKLLQVLRLDGNLLYDFNVWELSRNIYLNSLMLSSNPWSCDCEFLIPFRTWIGSKISGTVVDYPLTKCQINSQTNEQQQSVQQYKESTNNYVLISSRCNIPEENAYNSNNNMNHIVINNAIPRNPAAAVNIILPNNNQEQAEETEEDEEEVIQGGIDASDNTGNSIIQEKYNKDNNDSNNSFAIFWTCFGIVSSLLTFMLIILLFIFRKQLLQFSRCRKTLIMLNNSCVNSLKCGSFSSSSTNPSSTSYSTSSPSTTAINAHSNDHADQDCCCYCEEEEDKLFDAYFLYSRQDEDLLLYKICPELESSSSSLLIPATSTTTTSSTARSSPAAAVSPGLGLRLCLHFRDLCLNLESNPWSPEMIASAAEASKRVVILLSGSFLATEWTNNEFRQALSSILSLHQKKLIFILLPPLSEQNLVGLSTSYYTTTHNNSSGPSSFAAGLINLRNQNRNLKGATLEWTDENFWTKFKTLLPKATCQFKSSSSRSRRRRRHVNCRRQQNQHQHQQQIIGTSNNNNLLLQQQLLHPNYALRQYQQQQQYSNNNNNGSNNYWSSQASSQQQYYPSSLPKDNQSLQLSPNSAPLTNTRYYMNNLAAATMMNTLPFQWNNNNQSYTYNQNLQNSLHHQQHNPQFHGQGHGPSPNPIMYPPAVPPFPQQHHLMNNNHGQHLHQNSVSTISATYRPLTEQNYSDSTNTLGSTSSNDELNHIYSTLDSPTMIPNNNSTLQQQQQQNAGPNNNSSSLSRIELFNSNNSLHNCLNNLNANTTSSSGISSCEELVDSSQQAHHQQQQQQQHQSSLVNHSHFRSNSSGNGTMYFV